MALRLPCCSLVGVWFHPGTQNLHIRDGHGDDGNAGCDPPAALVANQVSTVRIAMMINSVEVFINGASVCTEARADRQAFTSAVVYASDPWHEPARASLGNFYMRPL